MATSLMACSGESVFMTEAGTENLQSAVQSSIKSLRAYNLLNLYYIDFVFSMNYNWHFLKLIS